MTDWNLFNSCLEGTNVVRKSKELNDLNKRLYSSLLLFGISWRSIDFACYVHRFQPTGIKYSGYPFLLYKNTRGKRFDQFRFDDKMRRTVKRELVYSTITALVSHFDQYLQQILLDHGAISKNDRSSNYFETLTQKLMESNGIPQEDVEKRFSSYKQVYFVIQNRHKIIHSDGKVDQEFIRRMATKGIPNKYKLGRKINANLFFVIEVSQQLRHFADELEKLLSSEELRL